MSAKCVMVLGTSSGAGKSWIATALCRHYASQGLRVAPFKAQNMSNNARVVPGVGDSHSTGRPAGEIGSAQYFQALAARSEPDVRMNPLLLKPESDTSSQVVLLGEVNRAIGQLPWHERGAVVWPKVAEALDALRAENDVVVIEGAGSPAEINLMATDIVNLRVARHSDARCLLVSDIDRGGALAHLYGTWALLAPEDRRRIQGFVLNKFRGDPALLAPGPEQLCELTGVPTLGVVPMVFGHGLPEEDGLLQPWEGGYQPSPVAAHLNVSSSSTSVSAEVTPLRHLAIVVYPHISNLDEFQALSSIPGLRVSWARTPADLHGADTIILPGSKATASDLAWLRARGLDACLAEYVGRGGRVLGICGGLQMLGEGLIDLHGTEPQGNGPGLGLLPLVTAFEPQKTVRRVQTRFSALQGAWSALSGIAFDGYEIHCGQTVQHPAMAAKGDVAREVIGQLAWQNTQGHVLGLYVHGLFENADVLKALFGAGVPSLDDVFDHLAATIRASFQSGALEKLIQ